MKNNVLFKKYRDEVKWISVEERIPEKATDEDTFFISDGESVSIGWYQPEYYSDDPTEALQYSDAVWHEEASILKKEYGGWPLVTHWMPFFLEPPKKEEMK